jgi:hypothetical protein
MCEASGEWISTNVAEVGYGGVTMPQAIIKS